MSDVYNVSYLHSHRYSLHRPATGCPQSRRLYLPRQSEVGGARVHDGLVSVEVDAGQRQSASSYSHVGDDRLEEPGPVDGRRAELAGQQLRPRVACRRWGGGGEIL